MAIETSAERYSFTATFELITGGRSIQLGQLAPEFVILDREEPVEPGPAELIIHYSDRPALHRQIEVLSPDPERPERLRIRR